MRREGSVGRCKKLLSALSYSAGGDLKPIQSSSFSLYWLASCCWMLGGTAS